MTQSTQGGHAAKVKQEFIIILTGTSEKVKRLLVKDFI